MPYNGAEACDVPCAHVCASRDIASLLFCEVSLRSHKRFPPRHSREMSEANGWRRLATNSAKLVNILGGYGYVPMLASMTDCVDAAETGELK